MMTLAPASTASAAAPARGGRAASSNSSALSASASATSVAAVDALFRGFADATRIRLLNLLTVGELCVCDLVAVLRVAQPVVSRHLAYLRRSGLVDVRRVGRFAHYRLARPRHPVHRTLVDCLHGCFATIPTLARERAVAARRQARRRAEPCDNGDVS